MKYSPYWNNPELMINAARIAPNSRERVLRGCSSIIIPPPVSPESSPEPLLERQSAAIFHSSDSDNGGTVSAARMQTHNAAKRVSFKLRMAFDIQVLVPDSQQATCTAALDHFSVSSE